MTQHRNRIRKKTKVALYIRVSSEEQVLHGYSLDAQREALLEYAEQHDMEVVDIYVDEGKTARKELKQRKEIFRLLNDIEAGEKGIEMILFIKIDRWFRNVADYHYVQRILEKKEVSWRTTQEQYDTETADGRMKVNIMLSIAENEADRTSERIKFVNQSKVKKGLAVYGTKSLPLGLKVEEIDGLKRVVIDPDTAPIVLDYIEHFETHNSKRWATAFVNEKYGTQYSSRYFAQLFKNRLYHGEFRDNPHYCEALITKERFDALQIQGKRNVRQPHTKRVYLFSGLIKCPNCGRVLVGNYHKRGNSHYKYYRCPKYRMDKLCDYAKQVSESTFEKYLLKNIDDLINDYIVKFDAGVVITKDNKKLERQIKEVEEEIERLNYSFRKNRISVDKYDVEYDELEHKLEKLKNELNSGDGPVDHSHLIDFINSDWKNAYESLTMENKRSLWRSLIKSIVYHGNKTYDIEFV